MNCLWCHNPEDISTSDNWCYWCNRYSNNWNLENILSNHAHVFDFKTLEDIDSFVFSKCLNPVRSENCVYKEKLRALPYAEYLENKEMREKSKYLHSKGFKDLSDFRWNVRYLEAFRKRDPEGFKELVESVDLSELESS